MWGERKENITKPIYLASNDNSVAYDVLIESNKDKKQDRPSWESVRKTYEEINEAYNN